MVDLPRPSKIVCVGRNYLKHAQELGNDVPSEPLIFLKPPSALLGNGETILMPSQSRRVDFEGEIAVVIGERARRVSEEDSIHHIAAVVPLNDVTARDLQRSDGQWTRAKGFDTFCPIGTPVPAEGIDLAALEVVTRVNGEVKQHGYARDMAFPIPYLVHWISWMMTLEPGDVVATGTPEGIAPLSEGDRVEVEIPGVGTVSNPVGASEAVGGP